MITAPVPFGIMLPLLVGCYLLSGLFLFIYYRKAHPWKEVVNARVQFCCLPSTPISLTPRGVCRMVGCLFLGCLQVIFSPVLCLCCQWWRTWCDCFGVNNFTWHTCDENTENGDTARAANNIEMDKINLVTDRPQDVNPHQDKVWKQSLIQ